MKLLIEANLSPRIAALLRHGGHDASHVGDHGLLEASDEAILAYALASACSIISADADHLTPDQQVALLLANLPALVKELDAGSVVSISQNHLRVRPLPIR